MKETAHQHGPEGANHCCVFCGTVYPCMTVHQDDLGVVLPGGRCCAACRRQNMLDLDKMEARRQARLYV